MAAGVKSGIYVEGFADSPEHCELSKAHFSYNIAQKIVLPFAFSNFSTDLQYRINNYCKSFKKANCSTIF